MVEGSRASAWWAVAWLLLPFCLVTSARAQPEHQTGSKSFTRVLLVANERDEGLVKRMRAELATAGFMVESKVATHQPIHSWSQSSDALAVLVSTAVSSVEVWTPNADGRLTLREVVSSEAREPNERNALMAMRTVEVLRATLIEIEKAKRPPSNAQPTPPPPAPTSSSAKAQPSTEPSAKPAKPSSYTPAMWLGVSGVVGWGRGASGTGHAAAHFNVKLHRWLATELAVVAPVSTLQLDEPEGRASVFVTSGLIDVDVPLLADSSFDVRVGGGVAFSWLYVTATANDPLTSSDASLFTSWPHAHVALGWAPIDVFRLVVASRVGVLAPRPVVQFANRNVLGFGRPYMQFSLGAELALSN